MQSAKNSAFYGNVISTLWAALYFITALMNSVFRLLDFIPRESTWVPTLWSAIVFFAMVIVGWMAAGKMEISKGWRVTLLIVGIVTAFQYFNIIGAIFLVLAFAKAISEKKATVI